MQQSIKLKTFLQTVDQAKKKVIDFFNGSTSTQRNSIYYKFVIDDKVDAFGQVDLQIWEDYCKSKTELTLDCICNATSTTYPESQCQKDKLCKFDLRNQSANVCPCLSTGDPRANDTCPAYCVKGNVTENCVCDSNITGYSVGQCQNEKTCKFDLIHQSNATCPCLSTADPRANGTCPAYCVKGNLTSNCTCNSNLPNYSVGQCQIDKACKFDLIHQSNATCPCLSTADPRAGGACPGYCIRGYVTSDCTCDSNLPSYPVESCLKEKKCQFELINQNTSDCPCQATGDPRAGGACPAYCIKGSVTSECVCDYYIPGYTQTQCQTEKKCKFDLADQTNVTCPCLSTGDPRAGKGQCPAYCTSEDQPSQSCVCDANPSAQYPPSSCQSEKKCTESSNSTVPKDSCTCSRTNYPTGCKCPTDSSQLTGIPINQCECRSSADPRANGICPAYCIKGKVNASCECDTNSSSFPLSSCQTEKKCITDLINQNNTMCPCLSTGDPRAGQGQCPAYCVKGQATVNCTCNTNTPGYTVDQCQKEKLCFADLINQPNTTCQCLPTGDPRAGNGQCPAYCIKDQVNESCMCDTNIPGYTQAQCQIEYQCKYDLANQSNATCPCLSTGDHRAGYGQCPAYCTSKDQPNQSCKRNAMLVQVQQLQKIHAHVLNEIIQLVVDVHLRLHNQLEFQQINVNVDHLLIQELEVHVQHIREKACTINLINQSNITCPCLSTGDPRAGLGQCPAYCVKGYTNTTCACNIGSIYYPIAQCNLDKLCLVDLIHQSIINCPCLMKDDPRDESICKSSDSDPTDPIIPDPSEKDPETEQEQRSGSKQDDEKKTEKEESKTFNKIWIIFIVIGIFAVAAIVIINDLNSKLNKPEKQSASELLQKVIVEPPDKQYQSSLESINTGGIKEDESPKSENSNSSDELKNKDNQVKDIESSE
ncbi:MAG: hypothetical protein EZS28_022021 [Streblomastix strix]|uniref:EGF-like domain-containing protein n=1 Tax=Streblomastix strix TaxID=222440 RepID=A0A5J4VIP1_9EUKA|nr:MAG: hypothetical protein EZS28_022021 [Streblomastix strix]